METKVVTETEGPEVTAPLALAGGAWLEQRRDGGGACVSLRSPAGALVVEYWPGEGRCCLHAPSLELSTEGDLALRAGGRLAIQGAEGVSIDSGASALSLDERGATLDAERLDVRVKEASWVGDRLRFAVARVELEARRLEQRVGELETNAGRVMERAKESYREVETLAQTRAGRLRFVAKESFHTLAERVAVKAVQVLSLRGERIHLD